MNENNNISDEERPEHRDFFSKVAVPFAKSKEEVWDSLSEKLAEEDCVQPKGKLITMVWTKVAAAVVIVFVTSTSFMRLYTTTIVSENGMHTTHILPDGSIAELNAASEIAYHPYWWKLNRQVSLEGEAFFEVKKGSSFKVSSQFGNTEVLGTSFNIYARNKEYKVFCKTGKVAVSNKSSSVNLIISPGDMAILDNKTSTGVIKGEASANITSWRLNEFNFNQEPLAKVLQELSIQYNVNIELDNNNLNNLVYSGRFKKKESVELTLTLICQTFNLKFIPKGKYRYTISRNK